MSTEPNDTPATRRRSRSAPLLQALAGAALLVAIAGCSTISGAFGAGGGSLPTVELFERSPANAPVITSGEAERPIFIADPGVYADDEGLHLFFTTPFSQDGDRWHYAMDPANPDSSGLEGPTIGTIGYAFSSDEGVTWEFRETPIILPDTEGWQTDIETAFPFRIGDRFFLLYSAHGAIDGTVLPNRFQIGVAEMHVGGGVSLRDTFLDPDVRLTKRPEPLIPAEMERITRTNNTQEPSATVRDGVVTVFFTGLGLAKPDASIAARGQDLVSIDFMSAEFDTDLRPVDGGEPRPLRINPPINIQEVRYHQGTYHVFFTTLTGTGEFHRGEQIGHATSTDGVTWDDPAVILRPSAEPMFDDWGMMAPTAAILEDKTLLFYSAFERLDRPPFPVPPDGRLGIGVDGDPSVTVLANIGRAVSAPLE